MRFDRSAPPSYNDAMTEPHSAAALDAFLVDQMMKSRGRMLGAIGGIAMAMGILAVVAFVSAFLTPRPSLSFGMSFLLFCMTASLSAWCYGEYLSLSSIDRRRQEAAGG